jgi:outer membrane PBP1 activator LpoA protein
MGGRVKMAGGEPVCDTYACAVNDKKVEFCYQCEDFPCLKLAPCADRAQETPHHNNKVYSLVRLQKLGIDAWLEKYPNMLRQYREGKKPKIGGDIQL